MKILHIGKYYPPHLGGIETVSYDLVEGLNRSGIEADILCFNEKSQNSFEKRDYSIFRCSTLLKFNSAPLSISMFFQLKKNYSNYDIIHLHLPNPSAAIILQSIPFKGKIILHWHSDIIKQVWLKRIYNPFQKALLKRADQIIVTSPPYLEGSNDLKKFKEKCTIIPIGIREHLATDVAALKQLRKKYENKKIIFTFGRLIYYKGFDFLIDAAMELPDDYLVIIGGSGELFKSFQNKIRKKSLQKKVVLVGKIPSEEMAAYFELSDVFCMPSCERSEAFGIVQVEAMSFAKPIISTDIPYSGVSWINQNQVTGLVVPPKNAKALAEAIKLLITNPELANNFGVNAKKRYLLNFTSEEMIKKTIALYNSISGI